MTENREGQRRIEEDRGGQGRSEEDSGRQRETEEDRGHIIIENGKKMTEECSCYRITNDKR